MIGGFYAQWSDNASEQRRSAEAQKNMLQLLERTETSVLDLSRLIEPIDASKITVIMKPDCETPNVADFCAHAKSEGRKQGRFYGSFFSKDRYVELGSFDWKSKPSLSIGSNLQISFIKNETDVQNYLNSGCLECDDNADTVMYVFMITVFHDTSGNTPLEHPPGEVMVYYRLGDEDLVLRSTSTEVESRVRDNKVTSIVDLPNSTIVLTNIDHFFDYVTIKDVYIETQRGETVHISNPKASFVQNKRIFLYHFGQKVELPVLGQTSERPAP
jgi:hypothetical protein